MEPLKKSSSAEAADLLLQMGRPENRKYIQYSSLFQPFF